MENFALSLGGSIIIPDKINATFLRKFRTLLLEKIKTGNKFIVVCGGGKTARLYQEGARQIKKTSDHDADWLGIHASRLNAQLFRTVMNEVALPRVLRNPEEKTNFSSPLLVAAGLKPGRSTDYQTVLFALAYNIKTIINISNIDYVYDKDPKKYKNAKKIEQISWTDFRKLVGNKWQPGLNTPFDPVASRMAQKHHLTVIMTAATVSNIEKILDRKQFKGTVITDN